jgi:hypothetical protein
MERGSGRIVGNPSLIGKVRFARHPPTIGDMNVTYQPSLKSPANVRLKLCSTDLADLLALVEDISPSRAAAA